MKFKDNKINKITRAFLSFLIAAVILLLFDLDNRKSFNRENIQIAVFKMASRLVLDETEKGVLDALKEKGLEDGRNCTIKRFSAEGDMPTANMIANNIISSKFDLVITISTPALQVMANANKEGKITHVFCCVTDPYVSGVGISGKEGHQHPKHLVGIGTFQPVEEAFEIAKKMNPKLKKVGSVWCTSETCSEACVRLARKKCKELGIDLLEMSVESSTQVLETAMSLTARGVEALWLGGDNVVELGVDQLINAASKAQIPLFINNPHIVYGNVLFGLGAEYYKVGYIGGEMAFDVLNGKNTSEIKIENVVPQDLKINPEALKNIKDVWNIEPFLN
jgi:ABC-type uncharacterized transport system substrate-binding protein